MNLETEAERKQAFVNIYGRKNEVDNPNAGISRSGFELLTFDPETMYAQFRARERRGPSDEYVEYAKAPKVTTPIKRRRFYIREIEKDFRPALHSADIRYPVGDYWVSVDVGYDKGADVASEAPNLFLIEIYSATDLTNMVLAKCRYRPADGAWPADIDITAGNLQEAEQAREKQFRKSEVPNAIAIRRKDANFHIFGPRTDNLIGPSQKWGVIGLGETQADPDNQNNVSILSINAGEIAGTTGVYEVLNEGKDGYRKLLLAVPRIEEVEWDRRMRGDWRGFVTLPTEYPVTFEYTP